MPKSVTLSSGTRDLPEKAPKQTPVWTHRHRAVDTRTPTLGPACPQMVFQMHARSRLVLLDRHLATDALFDGYPRRLIESSSLPMRTVSSCTRPSRRIVSFTSCPAVLLAGRIYNSVFTIPQLLLSGKDLPGPGKYLSPSQGKYDASADKTAKIAPQRQRCCITFREPPLKLECERIGMLRH